MKFKKFNQLLMAVLMLVPIAAFAGTTGTEFLALYTWTSGLLSGYGGRTISYFALGIAALVSLGKMSPIPLLVGFGFALAIAYIPGMINGVLSATI